jgi:hypothetical protein
MNPRVGPLVALLNAISRRAICGTSNSKRRLSEIIDKESTTKLSELILIESSLSLNFFEDLKSPDSVLSGRMQLSLPDGQRSSPLQNGDEASGLITRDQPQHGYAV